MSQEHLGLIIGGLVPAVLFGIAGVCQKWSSMHGISTGAYLVSIGVGVLLVGLSLCVVNTEQQFSVKAIIPAVCMGLCWGSGVVLVALGINKYGAPLSQLAPLYNMNTLVDSIDCSTGVRRMERGAYAETYYWCLDDHRWWGFGFFLALLPILSITSEELCFKCMESSAGGGKTSIHTCQHSRFSWAPAETFLICDSIPRSREARARGYDIVVF